MRVPVPGLDGAIVNPDTGRAIAAMFRFNWLGASGTAVCLAALLSAAVVGAGWRLVATVAVDTGKQLARSVATIAAFLAFAYVGSASGMTTTLGRALAGTGALFPFFSPLLGWLGVFITGSDTSANALFGRLQQVSADQLGLSPVLTVAANSSGGVTAKMISPQSIAVACAATGLVGREPELAALHAAALAHHGGAARRDDVAAGHVVLVDGAAGISGRRGRRGQSVDVTGDRHPRRDRGGGRRARRARSRGSAASGRGP